MTLAGEPVLERIEKVEFHLEPARRAPGVNANQFSVRWTGFVEATASGSFQFQTRSNDGVRLWINGTLVIDNWTAHAHGRRHDSATIALVKNERYAVTLEFYDNAGSGVARLSGSARPRPASRRCPITRLYAN